MAKKFNKINIDVKKYRKIGIIAAVAIAVGVLAIWGISKINRSISVDRAVSGISTEAITGADLRIAVIRMDEIQARATVLDNLRKQREGFESRLRDELTRRQNALEKEKTEIEKSQDMLSREALARRVQEYQQKVTALQRDVTERAQAIDVSFQQALADVQQKNLDPIINAIIARKNLSIVIDGRFARVSDSAPAALDITGDVVTALNKNITTHKMATPRGF
ncbi:MAG: OmpH family outer membrane protein [Alphaproteobacteria bacterium]|nr:OmpH family outer membrane protein [Alphaproteobacteria bacterium]